MQIRCYSCNTPFSMNRDAVHEALNIIEDEDLKYYGAPCPRCRKVNRLSKEQLLKAAPDWEYTPLEETEEESAVEDES